MIEFGLLVGVFDCVFVSYVFVSSVFVSSVRDRVIAVGN